MIVRTSQYNPHQNYLTTWQNRLEQYKSEFIEREKIIKERIEDQNQNLVIEAANTEDPWKLIITSIFEICTMIRDSYIIAGRGETIKAFIQYMETYPTPGLTDVWFVQ